MKKNPLIFFKDRREVLFEREIKPKELLVLLVLIEMMKGKQIVPS